MCKFQYFLLVATMTTLCCCGGKANKIAQRNVPKTAKKVYAAENSEEELDIPMYPCAEYSNGTLFYGRYHKYHQLSESEINLIKIVLSDKEKWLKTGSGIPILDINKYYRQYLAYNNGDIYVMINLYKYYYIVFDNNNIVGACTPAWGIQIISLVNDKSRKRYDNVHVLLNLSKRQIIKVHNI
ncbi:hypothetical protein [Prevotella sp. oral taxon 317]|jgi:hypothetical protein|uniref:hypothetical protein n=1 Tax=Prevotella sp. oral taxon 317 TaxID=652721 RepID=UPI0001C40650|nr:hypothetical protein [Prevotella sp. oral taxon 317]EFC68812.1 hypothetical protein HMPREF0670_00135 [Prevotella sp. oral taxon 317 str. F0108]